VNTFLLGLAISVGAPTLKERPTDEPNILGDWKLMEWIQDGNKIAVGANTGVEFLPDGKRLWRDGPGEPEERRYKLYPKTSPTQIDLIRTDAGPVPLVYPCIFKFDGDNLIIAVGKADGDRPKTFDPASAHMVMTFLRLKKK
jgi:uncharacterized protein (TIGR03067 family)